MGSIDGYAVLLLYEHLVNLTAKVSSVSNIVQAYAKSCFIWKINKFRWSLYVKFVCSYIQNCDWILYHIFIFFAYNINLKNI